jgi:hypothetical protein
VDGPVKEAADITSAACKGVKHDLCHEQKKRILRGSAPKRPTKVLSESANIAGSGDLVTASGRFGWMIEGKPLKGRPICGMRIFTFELAANDPTRLFLSCGRDRGRRTSTTTRTIAGGSSYLTVYDPVRCMAACNKSRTRRARPRGRLEGYTRRLLQPYTQLDIADLETVQFRYDRKGRHAVRIDLFRFDSEFQRREPPRKVHRQNLHIFAPQLTVRNTTLSVSQEKSIGKVAVPKAGASRIFTLAVTGREARKRKRARGPSQ